MKGIYPVSSYLKSLSRLLNYFGHIKPIVNAKLPIAICLLLLFSLSPFYSNARILYVTPTGAGSHSGLSWANACTFYEAAADGYTCRVSGGGCGNPIANCNGDTLWIAQGTHNASTPPQNTSTTNIFFDMYGGFSGNETSFSQRNATLHVTKILGPRFATQLSHILMRNPCTSAYTDGRTFKFDGIEFDSCKFTLGLNLSTNNCTFAGCLIEVQENDLNATNCTFKDGGCIRVSSPNAVFGHYTFDHCNFNNLGWGTSSIHSAILTERIVFLTCTYCNFIGNTGNTQEGGAISSFDARMTLDHCYFNINSATRGGAVYAHGTTNYAHITNCTFVSNTSTENGGAIYQGGGDGPITDCVFQNNSSAQFGGAIYQQSDQVETSRNTFTNNSAEKGGAVYAFGGSYYRYNKYELNTASISGGAIYNDGPGNWFENSLFLRNTSSGGAGGIGSSDYASGVRILSNSFINNTGTGGSALIHDSFNGLINNNIFWTNNDQQFPLFTDINTTTNTEFNISKDGSIGTQADPLLTNDFKLQACSPAINAGDHSPISTGTTDLAGNPRIVNGVIDIGAYEYDGTLGFTPKVVISASKTSILPGTVVTFTATAFTRGYPVTYIWYKNQSGVKTSTDPFYVDAALQNGDFVQCQISVNVVCPSTNLITAANSQRISITVEDIDITTSTLCLGGTLTESFNNNANTLSWQKWVPFAGGSWNAVNIAKATVDPNADTIALAILPNGFEIADGGMIYLSSHDAVFNLVPTAGGYIGGTMAGGNRQGAGTNQIGTPSTVRIGPDGYLYIGDLGYPRILKWLPGAQSGVAVAGGVDIGSGPADLGSGIRGFSIDASGNLYIADMGNNRIQKWAPGASAGVTVAGGNGQGSGFNQLYFPSDVALDASGNMYIADAGNNRIMKWVPGAATGTVIAGGSVAGNAANQFDFPQWIALDNLSNMYIGDVNNYRVQKWERNALSGTTVASGNGQGTNTNQFYNIVGVRLDVSGNLYVMDQGNGLYGGRLLKYEATIDSTFTPSDTGTYRALATSFSGNQVISNSITIGSPKPSVTIQADLGYSICAGMPAAFTATAVNGGDLPFYDWKVNGVSAFPTPTPNAHFFSSTIVPGDIITCELISNLACVSPATVMSNAITMLVPVASVSIYVEGGNPVCTDAPTTFTAFATIPEGNIFEWKKNGITVALGNDPSYTDYDLHTGDLISCILHTGLPCVSPNEASSNIISISVLSASITAPPAPVCQGTPLIGNFNLAASQFTWTQGTNPPQTFDNTWSPNATTVAGGIYDGEPTHTLQSGGGMFVDDDGSIYVSIYNMNHVQRWSQVDTGGVIIAGAASPPFASGSGAGEVYSPAGIFVDAHKNLYITDANNYRVQKWAPGATSGVTVAGGNGYGSGPSHLGFPVALFVDHEENIYICDNINHRVQKWAPGASIGITVAGGNGQFDAGFPDNGLSDPRSIFVSPSGSLYIGDGHRVIRWEQGASSGTTVAGNFNSPGSSASQFNIVTGIWMDGKGNLYVSDLLNRRIQLWKQGALSGITVVDGSVGATLGSPSYLSVDGTGNIFVYDFGNERVQKFSPRVSTGPIPTPATGPYTLGARSFGGCLTESTPVFVNETVTPEISITSGHDGNICAGTLETFYVLELEYPGPTPTFQWYKNGSPVGTDFTYSDNTLEDGDQVWCVLTSSVGCASMPTAQSNVITMSVNPAATISISANTGTTICSGTRVTFSATVSNAGLNPLYVWKRNGNTIGIFGASYDDSGLDNNDVITCDLITENCNVTSNSLTITVNPVPTPSVSISATWGTNICAGSNAEFIAQPVNGGASPSYQWYINNSPVGTNSSSFSSNTLANSDVIKCIMSSNATCASPLTATSNNLTMTVNPLLTPSAEIEITNGSQTSCAGSPITFTVTTLNAGTGLNYRFRVNGTSVQVGSSASYTTSTLKRNDSVSCTVGISNNLLCVTATTFNSNKIYMTIGIPPVIECPPAANINTDAGLCTSSAAIGTAIYTEGCGAVTISHQPLGPYAFGLNVITWKAKDASGDSSTCLQNVTVNDNQNPTFTCPSKVTVNADAGVCQAAVTIPVFVASDNCGVENVINDFTHTDNASGTYPVGTTTVHWTVTDVHGLSNACDQLVEVIDAQIPEITCPGDIAITASQATCTKQLTIAVATATDNCAVYDIKNNFNNTSDASGAYPVGSNYVVWTVTDVHTNTDQCTQIITVYPCIQISASVSNTICIGTSNGALTTTVSGGHGTYIYRWSNGPTTANLSGLAAGNYTVTVNDQTLGTATATFTVGTIVPAGKPATPGAISGLSFFCPNTTTVYSIAPVVFATSYLWTAPANSIILSGQGTTQVSVQFLAAFTNGTLSVQAANCNGSSAKSNLAVAKFTIPAKPAFINGVASICANSTQEYSISSVAGATAYTWSIPANCTLISGQNTTTISVQFQAGFTTGNIGVFVSNCAGNGAVKTSTVSVIPAPGKPGAISGTTSICSNVIYQYQINAVNNATSYVWTAPANAAIVSGHGTNSVGVQYSNAFNSGKITVYASNCSGNSKAETKSITRLMRGCGDGKTDEAGDSETGKAPNIEESIIDFSAKVYPNPFGDQFHIVLSGAAYEPLTIGIYSIDGRLVEERSETFNGADITLGSNFANGVYLIRICQGERVRMLRVVKSE